MERIKYLLHQYFQNKCSIQELNEFFELVTDPRTRQSVQQAVDELGNREEPLTDFKPGELREMVEAALHKKPVRIYFARTWWTAAAAAMLLVLGSGLYVFLSQLKNNPASQTASLHPDANPGSNRAILTLSDGVRLTLDGVHAGLIARQTGSNITITSDGGLSYNATNEKPNGINYNTLTTPRGGQYRLSLPDGTQVWLNAASSITYPTAFLEKQRMISMTGEAYFEVVHDARKPFYVMAGDQTIKDIGTAFNVDAYTDNVSPEVRTTLIEGSVSVKCQGISQNMIPGQEALTKSGSHQLIISDHTNIEKTIAWKNGKMVLSHGGVEKLMQDISRWYDVDVVYNGKIPDGQFSGTVNRNVPLSTLLEVLNEYGIKAELKGNKIIIH